ncbi:MULTISPECIES: hypothetical protein [unclassified Acinetobacter]|uniref:hypothetical protein n=1 Tax=unclassified Acinetobacter TaxID=196816 RepID=UPI0004D94C1E|nr:MULTISPECIES: hypothetical protein [unclassified Acinetobacter]KEC85412.1 hypothetical protein DT74_22040 [Acinetobacter sp. ETR1]WEE41518.1 hypothetical protein PYV58_10230 [Acinetobacter sp. TAC-1]
MMTLSEAEIAIYKQIGQFTGVEKSNLRIPNQPTVDGKPFVPPTNKLWCKAYIQYGDSQIAGIGNEPCIRDIGTISIQCFAPKNTGTINMVNLCDQWRDFLQSFGVSFLEVYKVHAPQDMDDDNFYAKIVRVEFRVN